MKDKFERDLIIFMMILCVCMIGVVYTVMICKINETAAERSAAESQEEETIRVIPLKNETVSAKKPSETEAETETEETIEETSEEPETAVSEEESTIIYTETESEESILPYVYYDDIPLTQEQQKLVQDVCYGYGLDYRIIYGQMYQESRFNVYAIGDNGAAIGILQVQPRWHYDRMERLGRWDLTNFEDAVWIGCDIMFDLMLTYGNYRDALTAYRYGDLTITAEDYASIVMSFADGL